MAIYSKTSHQGFESALGCAKLVDPVSLAHDTKCLSWCYDLRLALLDAISTLVEFPKHDHGLGRAVRGGGIPDCVSPFFNTENCRQALRRFSFCQLTSTCGAETRGNKKKCNCSKRSVFTPKMGISVHFLGQLLNLKVFGGKKNQHFTKAVLCLLEKMLSGNPMGGC